jgi:hypothetical protein
MRERVEATSKQFLCFGGWLIVYQRSRCNGLYDRKQILRAVLQLSNPAPVKRRTC